MMVTTRGVKPLVEVQLEKAQEYFRDVYGEYGFVRTRKTETLNAAGRVTGVSTETITIWGDLQFMSVNEKKYIEIGVASLGDGIFYTEADNDIQANDEITTPDGDVYRLTNQIEGETTQGTEIYQGWIAIRLPDAG